MLCLPGSCCCLGLLVANVGTSCNAPPMMVNWQPMEQVVACLNAPNRHTAMSGCIRLAATQLLYLLIWCWPLAALLLADQALVLLVMSCCLSGLLPVACCVLFDASLAAAWCGIPTDCLQQLPRQLGTLVVAMMAWPHGCDRLHCMNVSAHARIGICVCSRCSYWLGVAGERCAGGNGSCK